jgi:hypothetical protein
MNWNDPEQKKAYQREYHARKKREDPQWNQRPAVKRSYEKQRAKHIETKARLKQVQVDRGCLRCGLTDGRCLQWHHRDPTQKRFNIGEAKNMKWENLMLEVEKCDVLCANCHFIVEDELRTA